VTAFCGPVAFLGTAVPHLCRGLFATANHHVLRTLAGTHPALAGSVEIGRDAEHFTPVHALTAQARTRNRRGRGLNPLDTVINVAIPEFDGRIISVPLAFKEQQEDGSSRNVGDPERIARLADMVERMVMLRRKPNAKKRIAVVFTNSAAKASRIGNAVGLDAPASLMRLIEKMRAQGYTVEGAPTDSDTLLHNLIERCPYDQIWLTDA